MPGATSNEISLTATTFPYQRDTPSSAIVGPRRRGHAWIRWKRRMVSPRATTITRPDGYTQPEKRTRGRSPRGVDPEEPEDDAVPDGRADQERVLGDRPCRAVSIRMVATVKVSTKTPRSRPWRTRSM